MRVLIVDDEALARKRLRRLLAGLAGFEVVGEAADGGQAVALAAELRPDVVLLDIHMPGTDGLAAARELSRFDPPPAVVFTTAHEEHALDAFDLSAIDYLMKPVRPERLVRALDRAAERLRAAAADSETIRVYHRGGIRLLPIDEVILFRADNKYVTAVHTGGEALMETSLKTLEERFGDRFVRVHRNALVARNRLIGVDRSESGYVAVLEGSDERPEISRRQATDIKRLLGSSATI